METFASSACIETTSDTLVPRLILSWAPSLVCGALELVGPREGQIPDPCFGTDND